MTRPVLPPKPEIMSPAGHWPQLHAAVEAGADAVYFGLTHFSARAKVGFEMDDLPEVMATLHRRGVRGYVTFNTLIFDHELEEAARSLARIAAAGADAVIVQDVGIAQLASEIAPGMEVHGSTQMSITSAEGIALAQRFGVSRVVLARELSLKDIRTIRGQSDSELEIFVHGALCVSYSGQCFSSEAWGGRSANRGQCAQACRLPYELIVDDVLTPLGDARYLLSPGDLYALRQMPEIVEIGISALKIEGRYKDASYVALTTQAYRQAVDEVWAGRRMSITPEEELRLEQVYSRGLGPHFIGGTNHQTVVSGRAPRHRGLCMGRVVEVRERSVLVEPESRTAALPLKPGDGVVFDAADWRSPEQPEEGGRVYEIQARKGGKLELRFANHAIDFDRIHPGDLLWRTHDPEVDKAAKPLTQANAPVYKQPLQVAVTAHEGAPLIATWSLIDAPDVQVEVRSPEPLLRARKRALDEAYLRGQFERLGNTPYRLAELALDLDGAPFAPSSLLNRLRRDAVEGLSRLQAAEPAGAVADPAAALASLRAAPRADTQTEGERLTAPQLHLLVRTAEQLTAALALRPASITLDYLELYGLRPAVEEIQAAGIEARVAGPRILKPSEQRVVNFLLRLGCPVVVRSGGLLHALQVDERPPLIGDFSLNAANALTAERYMAMGLARITPTHDLNAAQVAELGAAIGPDKLEVIAYQHLPVFHTEHCVFCRFLSEGTSYQDCGHPCEAHKVALRDVNGRQHPVMADVGCRNTVFGAEAQSAAVHLPRLLDAGIVHFRLEFAHETADEVTAVTRAFQAALGGETSAVDLDVELARVSPQGTTEGSLFIAADYELIPLL